MSTLVVHTVILVYVKCSCESVWNLQLILISSDVFRPSSCRCRVELALMTNSTVVVDVVCGNKIALLQVHDRMTECVYPTKLMSFKNDVIPEPFIQIPVMEVQKVILLCELIPLLYFYNFHKFCYADGWCNRHVTQSFLFEFQEGRAALEAINKTMGLAFDEFDLEVNLLVIRIHHCEIFIVHFMNETVLFLQEGTYLFQ